METWLGAYLIDAHDRVARLLAGAGVRLAFTGHGHAQDITRGWTGAGPLWDVETGSLASWPNPWRVVSLAAGGTVGISSRRVTSIPSWGGGFAAYSEARMRTGLEDAARAVLGRMLVTGPRARAIAREAVEAGMQFFAGDEPGPVANVDPRTLGLWSGLAAGVAREFVEAIGVDLDPPDNEVSFEVF